VESDADVFFNIGCNSSDDVQGSLSLFRVQELQIVNAFASLNFFQDAV
jgi:hypothetical protein